MNRTTARLPDPLMKALQAKAEADRVSMAQVIRVALARHLRVPLDGDIRVFVIPRSLLSVPIPITTVEDLLGVLRGGNFIEAIKQLRTWSLDTSIPLGLYEAKCVIDELRTEA